MRPEAGRLNLEELKAALRPYTVLVSLMLVNNELGTVTPIWEVSRILKASGSPALLHTDAIREDVDALADGLAAAQKELFTSLS